MTQLCFKTTKDKKGQQGDHAEKLIKERYGRIRVRGSL